MQCPSYERNVFKIQRKDSYEYLKLKNIIFIFISNKKKSWILLYSKKNLYISAYINQWLSYLYNEICLFIFFLKQSLTLWYKTSLVCLYLVERNKKYFLDTDVGLSCMIELEILKLEGLRIISIIWFQFLQENQIVFVILKDMVQRIKHKI